MKTIDVTVTAAGEVTIETSGFEGAACQEATASLERRLGRARAFELKPEFYAQPQGEEQGQ
jgi:hypothetical protein